MILELRHVEKSFADKRVLKDLCLRAEGGRAFGLLGRNGAGKTTTIRILMGVFPADRGEVLVDGRPMADSRIGIGYLPEERGLYPKKKIAEQLVYFAELKGMRHRDAVRAVNGWLERLGMSAYAHKRLDTLSKGNQQKIQLITALAHDPDIVILDEPFSGLDPVNAMLLENVVKEQIARGKIVLFSSHQMSYVETFCDDIAILHEGRIALAGDLRTIKRDTLRDRLVVRSMEAEKITADFGNACHALENGELMLQLQAAADKQRVMQQLVAHYDIDEVRVFEPSLNDIFVAVAGDGVKEGR